MKNLVIFWLLSASSAWASSFVRADVQKGGELRFGTFLPLSDVVAIAPELRASSERAELNVGVTGDVGALFFAAWLGGGMRYQGRRGYLSPGLSFALEAPPIPVYIESWTEYRAFRVFGGESDEMLKRDIVLAPVKKGFAIGVQVEPLFRFPGGTESVHIGPRVNLGFGTDVIGGFAGWDTQGGGFMGRLTLLLRF